MLNIIGCVDYPDECEYCELKDSCNVRVDNLEEEDRF